MAHFRGLLLMAGMTLLACSDVTDEDGMLIGAWIIIETMITDSGETTAIPDPQPGLYIFTERHFSTMLVPRGQRQPISEARTDEERLAAFDNFVADAGTYHLEGSALVTDNIIAKIPNGMTARIPYEYDFDGDELLLTLESAWAPPGGSITYRLRRLE